MVAADDPAGGRTGAIQYAFCGLWRWGLWLTDVKGYKQVSHTGGLEGMVTQITMIPELQLGIIVLTNAEEGGGFYGDHQPDKGRLFWDHRNGPGRRICGGAEDAARSGAKKFTDSIWKEVEARFGQQWRGRAQRRVRDESGRLARSIRVSIGTPGWEQVTISMKNGRVWFDSKRSPRLTGEMLPYKGNSFIVKWSDRSMDADAYVIFTLDERGIATGIKMKPVSPLTDFSYDFQDLDFHREK